MPTLSNWISPGLLQWYVALLRYGLRMHTSELTCRWFRRWLDSQCWHIGILLTWQMHIELQHNTYLTQLYFLPHVTVKGCISLLKRKQLMHDGRLIHVFFSQLILHRFRQWSVACSALSPYLNRYIKMLFGPFETNVNEIGIKIQSSFTKIHLKMLLPWWPIRWTFCLILSKIWVIAVASTN